MCALDTQAAFAPMVDKRSSETAMGLSMLLNIFLALDSADLLPQKLAAGIDAYWSSALVNLLYMVTALLLSTMNKVLGIKGSCDGSRPHSQPPWKHRPHKRQHVPGDCASTSIYEQKCEDEGGADSTEVAQLLPANSNKGDK